MIAAYQRISRADGDLGKDGKDKSNSIENQKELIQRYISHKESLQNLPVMDFVDDGYTGSNFDRPGFQQMMDGVRSGKIDTIIVKDLSRFGRDYISVGEYMEQIFPLLGVRLIAINDNYDSNNYKGTTLGMDVIVSNLVNTMYCRDAGKKLRTANQVKWRKGITTASAAPFGYQFDPNKKGAFIIDPPAAKIVRRIFDLAILGLGTREIAMMLNDENVPVPSVYNKENKAYGKETTYTIAPVILWDSSRVWKILTAYVYTGAMVLGKTKTLISGKSIVRTVPKGQQFITEGTHEAIVSREEFEKAQLVIKSNSHKVLMGGVDFPLKGKVRCGNCRRVMTHNFKQAVPTFWCREGMELVGQTQCTSEVFQVSDIENAVFQALKKELSLLDSLYGDRDNSEWGRFFRDLLSASFDESVFAVDYAEQLFSEELEPQKYRKALALCQSIFSNSFDDFCNAEDKIKELAGLVYAQKETKVALNNLHSVIRDPHQLKNYVPARENELNIMTLHKSKGLEFNIVFHMDMYKWIIPNEFGDESSVQQDLNLHYVGLTRAKDACYIMNGTARFRSKKNDYIFAEPSLFLSKPGLAERRKDVRWEM